MIEGKIIVYVDEMTINSRTYPEYLRIKDENDVISDRARQRISHSIIAAATFKEVILFRIFNNTIDSGSFGSFLVALINHFRSNNVSLNNFVIILDNAPVHRAKKISPLSAFVHFLWLPAYCPHLNHIERVFALWKAHFKKKTYSNLRTNFSALALESLQSVSYDSLLKKHIEQIETYKDILARETIQDTLTD